MARSLRGRFIVLLALLIAAAGSAGALMYGLFEQSASAQAGQAEAEIGRACDAIESAYRGFAAGWRAPAGGEQALNRDLTALVQAALRDRAGVEGGVFRDGAQSLAYAFPTYQGAGPKTDLPAAEAPRIEAANRAALAEGRPVVDRFDASTQILLIAACPLPGPIPQLTGWAMTRVFTFAGSSYWLLMAGLGVLLASVLAAATLLTRLTLLWSRHVGRIEAALKTYDVADLPALPITGERELDRIVAALNEAGRRLALARQTADRLARQLAAGERLAAIGRLAAGLAHEIRNPIAAMRLKAENAAAGDAARKDLALVAIVGQIDRLDALLRRLLSVTARDKPQKAAVKLAPFLQGCIAAHDEFARAKDLSLQWRSEVEAAEFDPDRMRSALDNLVLNAIQAAPKRSTVLVAATRADGALTLSVHDEGDGPAATIRQNLFEPFVTGRADGVGLGLSIVREVAAAHGGEARLAETPSGTTFEIVLPCAKS
ncbi:MAG TPA: HAMP domain-containing sensor histidine kinase [Roseiarcus sp.]|nr:HAMP domain-containing sensor histidine kinase [Roseiarcus sp.]